MPPRVTVGTPPGHLPSYDVVSVVSVEDSVTEPESDVADGSGDNLESEGPYNQLGLPENQYWRNISISREADEGMFLSARDDIREILNVVTEPPSFKDVGIQTSTDIHDPMAPTEMRNPMASTWIKATVSNDVARQYTANLQYDNRQVTQSTSRLLGEAW
jgi:hypothetical protein